MDTGIVEGSTISMYYDPMISKVLVEAIKIKRQTYIHPYYMLIPKPLPPPVFISGEPGIFLIQVTL